MSRAASLLRFGSLPVQSVAGAVGYRQPAQFAKAFRRHHGTPPSAFRGQGERLPLSRAERRSGAAPLACIGRANKLARR